MSAIYNGLDRVVRIGASLLTFFCMSKFYEFEVFGYYAFVYTISASICLIGHFGLEQLSPKLFSKETDSLTEVFLAKSIFSIPLLIVSLIVFKVIDFNVSFVFYFVVMIAAFFNYNSLIFNYLNQKGQIKNQLKITAITFVISGFIKSYAILLSSEYWLVLGILLDSLVPVMLFAWKSSLSLHIFKFLNSTFTLIAANAKTLMFLALSTLFIQMNLRLDSIMLNWLMTNQTELSLYSMALRLNDVAAVIVSVFVTAKSPLIFNAASDRTAIIYYKNLSFQIFIIVTSMLAINIFLGAYFISFVFGDLYLNSVYILSILLLSTLFGGISSVSALILVRTGLARSRMLAVMIALFVNLILSSSLIPVFQSIGSAVSNVVSNFVSMAIAVFAVLLMSRKSVDFSK